MKNNKKWWEYYYVIQSILIKNGIIEPLEEKQTKLVKDNNQAIIEKYTNWHLCGKVTEQMLANKVYMKLIKHNKKIEELDDEQ